MTRLRELRHGAVGLPVVFLAAVALLLPAAPAAACSCATVAHACLTYPESDAVFLGRVVEVGRVLRLNLASGSEELFELERRARFALEERFRGVEGAEVLVSTGFGGGDCGYGFEVGGSFLVYAHRARDGGLVTSICSRTARAGDAAADLAYLRAVAAGDSAPGLFGRVFRQELQSIREGAHTYLGRVGVGEARILVEGPRGELFEALTDADGRFEIGGRLEGSYTARARLADGRELGEKRAEVAPGGCTEMEWEDSALGTVSGRVMLKVRDPTPPIELVRVSAEGAGWKRWNLLGRDGGFSFGYVPPGDYLLVFEPLGPAELSVYPRRYYAGAQKEPAAQPAGATRIVVAPGARVDLGEVAPPPTPGAVRLHGTVLLGGDLSAVATSIEVRRVRGDRQLEWIVTEDDGSFEVLVLAGEAHRLCASVDRAGEKISGSLEVPAGLEGPVELVLGGSAPCR